MAEPLRVLDQTPFADGSLTADDDVWLAALQEHVRASDITVRLGETTDEDPDHIVSRNARGQWQAGRYIGELSFRGRRLVIEPRLGNVVIERWLGQVLNLVAIPDSAGRQDSPSFIARLMGVIWCRAFDAASRHGPPAIRRSREHRGLYIRGRLDIQRTANLRGSGSTHVASISSGRDLDNAVARVLVAAERVLSQQIGNQEWRTPRVDELLPQLHAAVGTRPQLPTKSDLGRIRYSPITRLFRVAADLSWRIAQLEGFVASAEDGEAEGLLLDVAELWELFVLGCARDALPHLTVEHWTSEMEDAWLLRSRGHDVPGLGRLRPDVLVFDGDRVVAVVDAKYKRLVDWWPERPQGVDRADLYQLTSYMSRFGADPSTIGALVYPRRVGQDEISTAEGKGPWANEAGNELVFTRIDVEPEGAIQELAQLLGARTWSGAHTTA